MNKPLVSVVLVACNVDRFLAESIESVLGQTYPEFEFIIIDFGSTDRSEAIAASYAAKDIRIKRHKIPPCSLPEARNTGCFLARGQYIAIMDADDVSLPNRLLWEIEFMEKHPEVGVVGGAVQWINAHGRPLQTAQHPVGHREIQSDLKTHCVLWHPTVLIRKEAFVLVGGYRRAFTVSHDYDLWLRIAEHCQIANLERVVLQYRMHAFQVSLRKRMQQTLCKLAAQASATSRRDGREDPLNSVKEITPGVLVGLGVTAAMQQRNLASDCRDWIRNMCTAGEYSVALKAALEVLHSDLEFVDRREIADLHLAVSRLYWKQSSPLSSILSMVRAVLIHPVVVGRPLKPLLRRLRLV